MRETLERTRERFGYQWTHFDDLTPKFEAHFRRLIRPLTSTDFAGKLVLDAGCGYGRYTLCAAECGARVIGLDFSSAIEAAREVTRGTGIGLVRGDLLHPPFERSFDIVLSIGVLHHLPDPFAGFQALARCVRRGGRIVVWVYSAERRLSNILVEVLRGLSQRLSHRALHWATFPLAAVDFALVRTILLTRPVLRTRLWNRIIPSHIRLYADFPFKICWADWFDRLGVPVRRYYKRRDLEEWLARVGAVGQVVPTEDFGWTIIAQFDGEPLGIG